MTHRRRIAIAALLLAGCAAGSMSYSEKNNQQTVEQDLGTTFTVSLPAKTAGPPVYSANVLELVGQRIDEAAKRRTLEFQAKALGETEIKVAPDFSLRVRVTSASDRPGMHVHTR
jgi:hypothetical protein